MGLVEVIGDSFSYVSVALCRGVTVEYYRVGGFDKLLNGGIYTFGCRNAGVTDTEIENLILAYFALSFLSVFKKLSYCRTL